MGSNNEYWQRTSFVADNMDDLVFQGIQHIQEFGERLVSRNGPGLQAFQVDYVLTNSRSRLHLLRAPDTIRYLCRELIAYFRGSLLVKDGLSDASTSWERFAKPDGSINSNYGYYVFRLKTDDRSQYEWVIRTLLENIQSRRALININLPSHKNLSDPDFPCTVALQFLVREQALCCEVAARSVDAVVGLPYDLGFFSFLTELIACDLAVRTGKPIWAGYTSLRCTFTQVYDATREKADAVLLSQLPETPLAMPRITEPSAVLSDIHEGTSLSPIVQWIREHRDYGQE